jgi:EAL domain-containing protein (putative c-di-GMP-specific phosphodiesterase class I)
VGALISPRYRNDPLSHAVSRRDADTLAMVRNAIHGGDVMLAYQPVVHTPRPAQVAFYEGLVRVLDETGRIIPAADFLPVVEEQEAGRILDCLALEGGLAALGAQPDLRLAINMSARSIGYQRWRRSLDRALDSDPTVGERLILEITESSAMVVPELVASFMAELREKGVSFALDDFGAAHTVFRHFRAFQFDILKIDGQFIKGIASDPDNQVITRAMLALARQFDMFCIAEQGEDQKDAQYLSDIGVDCLQGYLFGAPSETPPWKAPRPRKRA